MKLKPLEEFICDFCGEIIRTPAEGWLEWLVDPVSQKSYGFRIVHHATSSPRKLGGCYQYSHREDVRDLQLNDFTGREGLARLLSFLDEGPYHSPEYHGPEVRDLREFTEILRRLEIPYYEEARIWWDKAMGDGYFGDANPATMYHPETLKGLVNRYATKE